MNLAPGDSEWKVGWRIVAGAAVANATGISLMFYTFSMFLIPMAHELGLSRGEAGMVQALIITAALGAPLIGRLTDRLGFHPVFIAATTALAAIELFQAWRMSSLAGLAVTVALAGLIGGGASSVLLTRPVSAHFRRHRGLALGLVAAGASLSTITVPPFLQRVIDVYGWREGFFSLALIAFLVGMPLVLALMPRHAVMARSAAMVSGIGAAERPFYRTRDFWLLVGANMLASFCTSGAISQLSPMIQDERMSAQAAAFGLSLFAVGQLAGKLAGGWLLDRLEPRMVAIGLTLLPAFGFLLFLLDDGVVWPVLVACVMLGILQGADVGIFAYFIARRFDVGNYGTVFGALHGLGWIATALGIVVFGQIFDRFGSYGPAQGLSLVLLGASTLLFLPLRLDPER
ncbi:MAG: MFS transporter [Novosphingobium sp.]